MERPPECCSCRRDAAPKLLERSCHYKITAVEKVTGSIQTEVVTICGACLFELWRDQRKLGTYTDSVVTGREDKAYLQWANFPIEVQWAIIACRPQLSDPNGQYTMKSMEYWGCWDVDTRYPEPAPVEVSTKTDDAMAIDAD